MPRPCPKVDRNDGLACLGIGIERSPLGLDDICSRGSGGSVCGTIVEDGIAVIVLACGDVERRPRVRHHERAQPDSFGQRKRSSQEQTMPDVKRGAAVIQRDIIRIGREGVDSRRVAVSKVQGIKPEQGKFSAQTDIYVRDELVLIEEAIRLILVNVPNVPVGSCAGGWRAGGIAGGA